MGGPPGLRVCPGKLYWEAEPGVNLAEPMVMIGAPAGVAAPGDAPGDAPGAGAGAVGVGPTGEGAGDTFGGTWYGEGGYDGLGTGSLWTMASTPAPPGSFACPLDSVSKSATVVGLRIAGGVGLGAGGGVFRGFASPRPVSLTRATGGSRNP